MSLQRISQTSTNQVRSTISKCLATTTTTRTYSCSNAARSTCNGMISSANSTISSSPCGFSSSSSSSFSSLSSSRSFYSVSNSCATRALLPTKKIWNGQIQNALQTNKIGNSLLGSISPSSATPVRHLNLHEYQSKDLMTKFKVRVQRGKVANTPEEAEKVSNELLKDGAKELVIKSQIHAGGRGKGHFVSGFKGGVKLSTDPKQIREYASKMLGGTLITHQTGPEGQKVQKVLVHESISFDREMYFCFLMDRAYNGPVIVVSPRGGMDIEEVAEKSPQDIHMIPIDIIKGIQPEQTQKVAKFLGLEGAQAADLQEQITNLYKLFIASDATQVEINPLVIAKENGKIYCVDAKINFDDNAAFRQKEIFAMRDFSMEDPREVAASKFGLNYIGLDGNIGCMVNGAGLAMATMDIIKLHGGEPANFLDVGGGANEQQVEEAFKILTSDKRVKVLMVNIFGGIMKCDTIANGIINAAKSINLKHPLVVRLAGTNVEKGNKLLAESGIKIFTAADLDDAAHKAVACLK